MTILIQSAPPGLQNWTYAKPIKHMIQHDNVKITAKIHITRAPVFSPLEFSSAPDLIQSTAAIITKIPRN